MRVIRWILCIPAGFVASVILGALAQMLGTAFGGANWYVWMVGGAASGVAFFWVAFRVAPERTAALKWTVVAIVGLLGLMATLGPLMTRRNTARAFAGVAMVVLATSYARKSVDEVHADLSETLS